MFDWIRRLFAPSPVPAAPATPTERKKVLKRGISYAAVVDTAPRLRQLTPEEVGEWRKRARPPEGVVPEGQSLMAMDSVCGGFSDNTALYNMAFDPDLIFLGYPTLGLMAQRVEYRNLVSGWAREVTREWVEIKGGKGDDDRVKQIVAEWERLGIRKAIYDLVEKEGYFGRAHLFVDVDSGTKELPLIIDPMTIKKGSFKGVRVIEPLWTYPSDYNSDNPFSKDFFETKEWFVMGQKASASRLLTLVSFPVPDQLKSMYSFGGVARAQLIKPYVDNWLRTRQSVSDTMHKFSKVVLKTDMSSILQEGGAETVNRRAAVFTNLRDNGGTLMVDMESEDVMEVSTPLSTLDSLQAQSFEQIAAAGGMPLIIYCRITPTGLNSSSEGEMRVWYDGIAAYQESHISPILDVILKVTQLSLFGAIDPDIKAHFVPLHQLNDLEKATLRKTDADAAAVMINSGVLDPADERTRVETDEDGLYYGKALKEPPAPEFEDDDNQTDFTADPPEQGN